MNRKIENVKAVIFDLDGTLIDTERIYRQIWPKAIAELGFEMKEEQYLALRSLGRVYAAVKMREWFGEGLDYDRARSIRTAYFKEHIAKYGIQRKKGAIELLEYLRGKGIVTAIATATDPERAKEYLEMTELNGYFDKIISATMVKEGKPSPQVYLYACEQLGLEPAECVAVEDAPNGIKSAYRAGCQVIMVPDQTGPDEDIEGMYKACVDSLDIICELL